MRDALAGLDANKAILVAAWLVVIFRNLAMLGFFAYRWNEGLWGNILLAFNIFFATLLSVNYYEPLSKMIIPMAPTGLFYWDALVFAGLFLVSFIIFTLVTEKISTVVVAFPEHIERFGNPIVLAFIVFVQILPLYYIFLMIAPVAPEPIAGTQTRQLILKEEGKYKLENMFFLDPYLWMSEKSLSGLKGAKPFYPRKDFRAQQYNRRCLMFKNIWTDGKSASEEKPEFLNNFDNIDR